MTTATEQADAALQLAGELQRSGNVVSSLRGGMLVIDTSQPSAYEDLIGSLRDSDDFKDLRLTQDPPEFRFVGVRFTITRDGVVTYIEAAR